MAQASCLQVGQHLSYEFIVLSYRWVKMYTSPITPMHGYLSVASIPPPPPHPPPAPFLKFHGIFSTLKALSSSPISLYFLYFKISLFLYSQSSLFFTYLSVFSLLPNLSLHLSLCIFSTLKALSSSPISLCFLYSQSSPFFTCLSTFSLLS